jgi:hypothetical protein
MLWIAAEAPDLYLRVYVYDLERKILELVAGA